MSTRILVVYHKPSKLIQNETFAPILVGANKNNEHSSLFRGAFSDNDGENISDKNPLYNEMTAIYWVWKNYDKIGNPDYIGLCHYRRFFVFEKQKNPYQEISVIDDSFYKKIKYSLTNIENLLRSGDFVAPIPSSRQSVKLNYARAHRIQDLELVQKIINEKYPEYSDAAQTYFNGKKAYFHNMFIFDKKTFFEYCEWIFGVLFEFERTAPVMPDRMFISERLTGVFFTKLEQDGKKAILLPTLYVAGKKQSLKAAIAQTKQNLRLKNSSIFYSLKPIIVYFTPKFILKLRRSKRA